MPRGSSFNWSKCSEQLRRAIWLASFAAEGKPDGEVGPDELLLGVIAVKDENVERLFEAYGLNPLRFVEENGLQLPLWRDDLATTATLGDKSYKVLDRCVLLARSRSSETFTVTHMLGAIFFMEGGLIAKLRRKLGLGYHEGMWLTNLLIMDAWSWIRNMGQNRLAPVQPHDLGSLLRDLAHGFVRYPERLEPVLPAGSRILLLWEEPVFAEHFSWSLFEEAGRYLVREVTWSQPSDALRSHDPLAAIRNAGRTKPAILWKQAVLEDNRLAESERLIESGRALSIPLFATHRSVTIDGVTSGITSTNPAFNFEWNVADYPDAWEPLVRWTSELRGFMKDAVEAEHEWIL